MQAAALVNLQALKVLITKTFQGATRPGKTDKERTTAFVLAAPTLWVPRLDVSELLTPLP